MLGGRYSFHEPDPADGLPPAAAAAAAATAAAPPLGASTATGNNPRRSICINAALRSATSSTPVTVWPSRRRALYWNWAIIRAKLPLIGSVINTQQGKSCKRNQSSLAPPAPAYSA